MFCKTFGLQITKTCNKAVAEEGVSTRLTEPPVSLARFVDQA